MTIRNLLISIFLIGSTFFSCISPEHEKNNSQQDSSTDTISVSINGSDVDNSQSDIRNNWQKPTFVIDKLGDLNGKTVADIGAGALGYFVFKILSRNNVEKVIAIDIDSEALEVLNQFKLQLPNNQKSKLEIRLAEANDSKLEPQEVDVILIVNTIAYISNRTIYFEKLKQTLKPGGKIVIVDFKTKRIPGDIGAPSYEFRSYLHIIEEELYASGFTRIETDDTSLNYQYLISASL